MKSIMKMNLRDQLALVSKRPEDAQDMFWDWFCSESSLATRAARLASTLQEIVSSPRFDPADTYSFFKNNCMGDGTLYDDFRICDRKTGDVLFCVAYQDRMWSVFGKDNGFESPFVIGKWPVVKAWFNSKPPSPPELLRRMTK